MRLARTPVDGSIPTASMADIAFLLIVYFMLTLTFAATRGLDLALPEEHDQPPLIDPIDSVLVEVLPGGALRVDSKPLAVTELLDHLAPILGRNPAKPVIVRPLPETGYGDAVDVLDELRQGGRKLGLEDEVIIALPTAREIELFWIGTGS